VRIASITPVTCVVASWRTCDCPILLFVSTLEFDNKSQKLLNGARYLSLRRVDSKQRSRQFGVVLEVARENHTFCRTKQLVDEPHDGDRDNHMGGRIYVENLKARRFALEALRHVSQRTERINRKTNRPSNCKETESVASVRPLPKVIERLLDRNICRRTRRILNAGCGIGLRGQCHYCRYIAGPLLSQRRIPVSTSSRIFIAPSET